MKKKYIIAILLLTTLSIFKAQTELSDILKKNTPNVTTPELAKLLRYNDFPDMQFIGGTNIEVPLYNIKLNDIEIPIKLTYTTKGIKVSEIASNVGLGWTLIANGNISKQINDIEDFSFDESLFLEDPTSTFEPAGPVYMRTVKGYFEDSKVHDLSPDFKIDSSPDSYIVNAPGLSTKFYLQKDPSICPQRYCNISTYRYLPKFLDVNSYKADPLMRENGESDQYKGDYQNAFKKITIYNGKGYEYNFTNPSGNELWTLWSNPGFFTLMGSLVEDRANTWYLEYIKSPTSQNKVEYIYEDYTINYNNPVLQRSGPGFGQLGLSSNTFKEGSAPTPAYVSSQNINYNSVILTENFANKRLKKINFNEGVINFYYINTRQDYDDKSLDRIEVSDKSGKIIKTVNFYYSYFLPKESTCTDNYNCLRLRLDKIVDSSNGEYNFNYGINNSNYAFPKRSSSKTDFQGYFNDNTSDINFTIGEVQAHAHEYNYYPTDKMYYYSDLARDNFLPFKLNGITNFQSVGTIDKTPNEKSLIGLLTNIVYPTKGSLNIEYENDDFEYLGSVYKTGSARIKKMKYYGSDNSLARQIEYSYKNENNMSSGLINYFKPPIPTSNDVTTSYEVPLEFNKDGIVGYSRIEEIESGKGRKVKKYSNISDFPDNLPVLNDSDCNWTPSENLTPNEVILLKKYKFPFKNIENYGNRRGNLVYEGYFKENSTSPIYEVNNTYNYYEKERLKLSNLIYKSTGTTPSPGWGLGPGCKLFSESYLTTSQVNLTSSLKKNYYNQDLIQNDEQYFYDQAKNLLKKSRKVSNSGIIETNYKNSEDKGITKLVNSNIIDDAIEIQTIKKNNDSDAGKMISKIEIKYDTSPNLQPNEIVSYDILSNNPVTEASYNLYDTKGNLQQYNSKDGIPIVMIWGYNQALPIAKIEGKDAPLFLTMFNTDITVLSNASNSDVDAVTEEQFRAKLNTFQKRQFNLEVSITTYTHDPLIGVTCITPPSGIREVYIYDTANRLKEIRQDSNTGKLLKEFKYNYKN